MFVSKDGVVSEDGKTDYIMERYTKSKYTIMIDDNLKILR